MKKASLGALAAGLAALCFAAPASAQPQEPTVCNGTLANQVVDDVYVPYTADCRLERVLVLGDVTASIDSGAIDLSRSIVAGDVSVEVGGSFTVRSATTVFGSVTLTQPYGAVKLTSSIFRGDVNVINALAPVSVGNTSAGERGNLFGGSLALNGFYDAVTVEENVLAGDLTVSNGLAASSISRNKLFGGTLTCETNDPAPQGGRNVAAHKVAQCAGL